jgi:phage/plasmid-associated DNA primase
MDTIEIEEFTIDELSLKEHTIAENMMKTMKKIYKDHPWVEQFCGKCCEERKEHNKKLNYLIVYLTYLYHNMLRDSVKSGTNINMVKNTISDTDFDKSFKLRVITAMLMVDVNNKKATSKSYEQSELYHKFIKEEMKRCKECKSKEEEYSL